MNKPIEIERTRKDLTPYSGLLFFENLISRLNLMGNLGRILPKKGINRGPNNKERFLAGLYGFICGAEAIDDHEDFRNDRLFCELTNGAISPVTMGRFLGLFKLKHFERLQDLLPVIALKLRNILFPKKNKIIITMDATPHKQYGEYMEGVDWCYNKEKGYITQNAFDEKGLCYGWKLMPGTTHSHNGALEMLERIFSKIPSTMDRYFRADSAYWSHKIYNSLINLKIKFTICVSITVWGSVLDKYGFKIKWRKTKLSFFESKKCQIGSIPYRPKDLKGKKIIRLVYIRAKKKVVKSDDRYTFDYYAIATNMTEKEMSNEDVIRFYRGRSNAENFIKDLKYGMDFKHFPCQSINRNRAWGFMGIYAYNLMKYASYLIEKNGCFLKKVRRKMVYLAAEIRKGQRKIRLRFTDNIYKEVMHLWISIHRQFCPEVFYRLQGSGQSPPL